MKFNIYYVAGGHSAGAKLYNVSQDRVGFWVDAILNVGGEVTGIINVEND